VVVIGRKLPQSPALPGRRYRCHRFSLLFNKGPLFYAEYNLRLFWFLLWHKADILVSNDLDTLLPNRMVSFLKRIPLVYDSHEYFTGVPELTKRPRVRAVWKYIERKIVPGLKYALTVNQEIARLYREEYNVDFRVLRNVPEPREAVLTEKNALRRELQLPEVGRLVILQGAGINIDRGAEEAVQAMRYLDGVTLLVIGSGDVIPHLKKAASEPPLQGKVVFIDRKPPGELFRYTSSADIGLSLDKDTNLNYKFSLPNKLFDYIHAGIPVLASDLPEVRRIVEQYQIGRIVNSHDPIEIANTIRSMLDDITLGFSWKSGLEKAAKELNWNIERKILLDLFKEIGH
jgi:glycosyltransferase involved in cell wall biosynthesis